MLPDDLIWKAFGLPDPTPEYRFHPKRKWRFDYAWLSYRVAVEIEGGIWTGGRHTRGLGFMKDMEKYNAAAALGWRIFRFTPKELRDGVVQQMMKGILLENN